MVNGFRIFSLNLLGPLAMMSSAVLLEDVIKDRVPTVYQLLVEPVADLVKRTSAIPPGRTPPSNFYGTWFLSGDGENVTANWTS